MLRISWGMVDDPRGVLRISCGMFSLPRGMNLRISWGMFSVPRGILRLLWGNVWLMFTGLCWNYHEVCLVFLGVCQEYHIRYVWCPQGFVKNIEGYVRT